MNLYTDWEIAHHSKITSSKLVLVTWLATTLSPRIRVWCLDNGAESLIMSHHLCWTRFKVNPGTLGVARVARMTGFA